MELPQVLIERTANGLVATVTEASDTEEDTVVKRTFVYELEHDEDADFNTFPKPRPEKVVDFLWDLLNWLDIQYSRKRDKKYVDIKVEENTDNG